MSNTDKPNTSTQPSPKNSEEAFAEMIKEYSQAMDNFQQAMQLREDFSLRIAKRTTQIIRFGMIGMLLLAAAMFFLIYILMGNMQAITDHMIDMSGYMQNMSQRFDSITGDMQVMRTAMQSMEQNVQAMPQMGQDMTQMNRSMGHMSQNFGVLTNQVGAMTHDVNQMSRPMHFFPFQ